MLCFITCQLIVSLQLFATVSDLRPNEYLQRTWTIGTGLPQNTINALVQTGEGYIWIGTPSGLARFDGVNLKIFNRHNTSGLKNDWITTLHEGPDDVLWIGTTEGLFAYLKGSWTKYTTQNGLSNNHIRALTSDWRGNLWVGTDYGLNRLNLDGVQIYTTQQGLYDNIITALTLDYWGNLWIGTLRGGLAKFTEDIIQVYDYDDGLLNPSVYSLAADGPGNLWIGTMAGLYQLKPGEEIVRYISGTSYTPITSILQDNHGSFWLGTMADDLLRLVDGVIDKTIDPPVLPDDFVRILMSDRDGNIWIGTDSGGLVQLKRAKVNNLTKQNGLPENSVCALFQDDDGAFWIGTRNSGLVKIKKGRRVTILDKTSGLSSNRPRVIFKDNKGILWIGTEDAGINRLYNGKIDQLNENSGLTSTRITAILQDATGTIWIGTDNGLNQVRNGRIRNYNSVIGFENPTIRVLLESRDNTLYIGTTVGLLQLADSSCFKLSPAHLDAEFDIMALYEDGTGVLWIGTNGNGLKRWRKGDITFYTKADGLPDNYVFSITGDENDNIWLSSYNGVLKIPRRQLNDFADHKISRITPTWYDEADGMISRQCDGGGQPSFCQTKTGQLCYPTVMGISVFDPGLIPVSSLPPEILIEDILADNISVLNNEKMSISHRCDHLEIHFTAIDFLAPEKLRFCYQLEGYDPDVVHLQPGAERVAHYFNLDAGDYRFFVNAVTNDGIWNEKGAVIEFEIRAPVYRNRSFYLSLLVLILVIGTGIAFSRKKRRQNQATKYKTSTLDPQRADIIVPKLLHLMTEQKLFLNPDLSLKDLAHKLALHYNHLSQIINERFGLGYNDFINKYRIEEVKRKLSVEKKKTIYQIMYDCGFYSKSVFNSAFKKFAGMTPSEYKKTIQAKPHHKTNQ